MKRSLLSMYLMVQAFALLFVSGISLDAQRATKPKPSKQSTKPAKKAVPVGGGVFGVKPYSNGGSIGIVYVLDISGSMRRSNKIGQAREALKRALLELQQADTFNVILFARRPELFSPKMLPATQKNIQKAVTSIEKLGPESLRDGTNFAAAMEAALSQKKISHVFLMSDGEPTDGVRQTTELRKFIKEINTQKASIMALALTLDEYTTGFEVMRSIAEDNNGKFSLVHLRQGEP